MGRGADTVVMVTAVSSKKPKEGIDFLKAAEKKNIMLLVGTNKDMDLLEGVYGKSIHTLAATSKKKAAKK